MSYNVFEERQRYWAYMRQKLADLVSLTAPSWPDLWDLEAYLTMITNSDYEGRIEADLVERAELRVRQWRFAFWKDLA